MIHPTRVLPVGGGDPQALPNDLIAWLHSRSDLVLKAPTIGVVGGMPARIVEGTVVPTAKVNSGGNVSLMCTAGPCGFEFGNELAVAPDRVVLHELTALPKAPIRFSDMDRTNTLRTEGSRNLLEVAKCLGARRFVTQSITLGYGFHDHGDHLVTEADPFGRPEGKRTDAVLEALTEAEGLASQAGEGIALRYGLLYGGDAPTIVPLLRRRMVPLTHGGVLPWIHHEDAASATVAAIERGSPGAYNVVDARPATFEELFNQMAAAIGAPKPWHFPRWLLSIAAPYVVALASRPSCASRTPRPRPSSAGSRATRRTRRGSPPWPRGSGQARRSLGGQRSPEVAERRARHGASRRPPRPPGPRPPHPRPAPPAASCRG